MTPKQLRLKNIYRINDSIFNINKSKFSLPLPTPDRLYDSLSRARIINSLGKTREKIYIHNKISAEAISLNHINIENSDLTVFYPIIDQSGSIYQYPENFFDQNNKNSIALL